MFTVKPMTVFLDGYLGPQFGVDYFRWSERVVEINHARRRYATLGS